MNVTKILSAPWGWAKRQIMGVGRSNLKSRLVNSDPTSGYKPSQFFSSEVLVNQLPFYSIRKGKMMLDSDPIVEFALNVRNAALAVAEVEIKAKSASVQNWLDAQWNTLWELNRSKILAAKRWGFAGLQPTYRINPATGLLDIDGMKDFAPEDIRAQESNGKQVGFRVRHKKLFGPHALWLTFGAEYGSPYGKGCCRRMYPPWYLKWMDHGVEKLVQLRMIKDAYIGDIFWYPENMSAQLPDGNQISFRDLFRQIGENRLSGAGLYLPMITDDKGNKLSDYSPPTSVAGATDIFQWKEIVDEDILKGADVPSEVVKASETGSGYSGRSIPFMVLLSVCNGEFVDYVQAIEKFLRIPAWLNFGGDPEFEIKPKSLVESFAGDAAGSPMGGGAVGGQPGQQRPGQGQQPGGQPPQNNGPPQRFDEDEQGHLRAPPGGVAIKGKFYKGGEFIPKEVVDQLSEKEREQIAAGESPDAGKDDTANDADESEDSDGEGFKKPKATRGAMQPAKRVGKGKEAQVIMADGSPAPEHIKPGMIPPNWTDIQVSTDPEKDVLVTGRDAAGRPKTVYADSFHMRNAALKFARVREGVEKREALWKQNQANRKSGATREEADCVWLMMEQATRPGSDKDTKAKQKAFGATTLRAEHVVETAEGVRLQFIGKEGVYHNHLIRNPELAKMLLERKDTAKTRDGNLFATDYEKVHAYSKTLDGGRFTPKDFRTIKGTSLAVSLINADADCCKSEKEYKSAVKKVAEQVSSVLGNRPAQALESYIDPSVFTAWRANCENCKV